MSNLWLHKVLEQTNSEDSPKKSQDLVSHKTKPTYKTFINLERVTM